MTDHIGMPPAQGLYDPANEHDNCGVGFIANIKGLKSHSIVKRGIEILCNLTHRGAVGADPLDGDGQFCDRGPQYRSELFFLNGKQQQAAQQSLDQLNASGTLKGPIKTKITEASTFYLAEDYHQDYYKKNPTR